MNSKYFEVARKAAYKSDFKARVGACLVIKGRMFVGFNRGQKTHAKSPHMYHSIHAEFDAIRQAGLRNPDLKYGEIYIYRLKKDNSPGLAKPCSPCLDFLKLCGIKKFFYTGEDGFYSYDSKEL